MKSGLLFLSLIVSLTVPNFAPAEPVLAGGKSNFLECYPADIFDSMFSIVVKEDEKGGLYVEWGDNPEDMLNGRASLHRGYRIGTKTGDGCILKFSGTSEDGSIVDLEVGSRDFNELNLKSTHPNQFSLFPSNGYNRVRCKSTQPERLKNNLACGPREWFTYLTIDKLK